MAREDVFLKLAKSILNSATTVYYENSRIQTKLPREIHNFPFHCVLDFLRRDKFALSYDIEGLGTWTADKTVGRRAARIRRS